MDIPLHEMVDIHADLKEQLEPTEEDAARLQRQGELYQRTMVESEPVEYYKISQPYKPNREARRAASRQSRKKGSRIHGR